MNAEPRWFSRPGLLAGVLALTLMSCTNTTPPEPVTPPPVDPPAAGLPDGALTALVHGDVNSPVYDALKDRLTVVSYDGSQKAADHDVLIFDGDHHDPVEHAKHPLVDEALRAGTWVLGVDVDEAHKQDSLGEHLGASTPGPSHSYLVRTEADDRGRPSVWIVEAMADAAPVTTEEGATVQRAATPTLQLDDAGDFAAGITARLNGVVPPSRNLTPQQNANVPAGLTYKTINYAPQMPVADLGAAVKNSDNGTQQASAQYNYVFNVYLDNANNADGNFQYVAADAYVFSYPTNATYKMACDGCYAGGDSNDHPDEYAWFMSRQRLSVGLVGFDQYDFTPVAKSPTNVSNVTEYTSSLSFDVGFFGVDKADTFEYRTSETSYLLDWRVSNESGDNETTAAWHFRTASPWNADQVWGYGVVVDNSVQTNDGWNNQGYPQRYNLLSVNGAELHAQAAWKSTSVLDRTVRFQLIASQEYLDVYCGKDAWAFGCGTGSTGAATKAGVGLNQILEIDMNMPVASVASLESITFDTNPVGENMPTKATITLSAAAPWDMTINLSSNSDHAHVLNSVTIPEGAKTLTTTIWSSDGVGCGESATATIRAWSDAAGEATGQLTVTGPVC